MAGHITSRGKRRRLDYQAGARLPDPTSPTGPRRSKEFPHEQAAEDGDDASPAPDDQHERRLRVLPFDERSSDPARGGAAA